MGVFSQLQVVSVIGILETVIVSKYGGPTASGIAKLHILNYYWKTLSLFNKFSN